MKVVKINEHEGQINYLGRWVSIDSFRTFVYDSKGKQKLANSYDEFESLIASGLYFAEKPVSKERKQKNDTIRANSE